MGPASPALQSRRGSVVGMGRPKSRHSNLPPRMIARVYPSGRTVYYYNVSPTNRIPLGDDLNQARLEWAKHENADSPAGTFRHVVEDWKKDQLASRGHYTQAQYRKYLVELTRAFGHIPLEHIQPVLCQQYLLRRSAKIMANRELSLLSTIYNWARRTGLTIAANPLGGVLRNKEAPRKVYVTDEQFNLAHAAAGPWLQDAMDLALFTGQRPGDVLKMTRQDVRDGCLWITQDKTGAKLRIEVVGRFKDALERLLTRPRTVQSVYLVADEKGQRITVDRMQKAFQIARGSMRWQFRDIRKKTATDVDELRGAQRLLGHANEMTTARVYRQLKGEKVKPLR